MRIHVPLLAAIALLVIATGCVQDTPEMGHTREHYDPELETGINLQDHLGPASDLMVPDNSPGNLTKGGTQDIDSQRDYGWHKNRINSVETGRVKNHPRLRDDPEALQQQVDDINQQYGDEADPATIKEKIEALDAVSHAHVVSHDNLLYIGIEGSSMNDGRLQETITSLVGEDEDFVWHTDRRAVHRIRAAEKTMAPDHEFGAHEWLEDAEYELQKIGDDWSH
ncbi:YhcN/YlaJ family sporulation lipoprotein [Natribacillus halophilus]|uniref:Sporulation lipoprotein YhcN/YlaJ (Spore_YhcN_YlaJ) n=1 Tax=Natribacillus halophilus TaxID=549003 RepID=A0A1G8J816_9BACI|nr:YhcN/YlaJ family sporulation lipoprotein [Natribacillus halophilus]SDI27336.1 Sporulation lipoprotein YhcN/YlaJ (Spore_YhcN_YlaJ) [Natribacillus halophilus]